MSLNLKKYKYKINATMETNTRQNFIRNLRVMAMYMEDEVTDEDFHKIALGKKTFPKIENYKVDLDKLANSY